MKNLNVAKAVAAGLAAVVAAGSAEARVYGDLPDAKHAWAVHDWNRPKPTKVEPAAQCGGAPSDAIVLFDGTKESLDANWCDGKGNPAKWVCHDGVFTWQRGAGSIKSKAAFGDCQLHLEYRHDPAHLSPTSGAQMRGNSGVFLMGSSYGYEVQVLESYYTSREAAGKPGYVDNYADGQAGAVYAENPPMVNPARKPGEWQVYDIVFHQPRWQDGKLVHPGSLTVFFNGVLVQDHWEMEGQTTHCRRRPLKPHPTTGQLSLQDHGCEISYRNIWLRPLPSRWDNLTHSAMSADEAAVTALRRETAAKLYAKLKDSKEVSLANMNELAEVIAYSADGEPGVVWREVTKGVDAMLAGWTDADWTKNRKDAQSLAKTLDVLVRGAVVPKDFPTLKLLKDAAVRLKW